jgi:hypothetical protein
LPPGRHRVDRPVPVDRPSTTGIVVKPSQHFRDRVQVVLNRSPALDEGGKPNGVRIAPHDDHRFGQTASGIADVGDAQITAGESRLLRTTSFTQARSRLSGVLKPMKSVTIGFLIFVGLVTDQNDDARGGFAYLGGCVSDAGPCRSGPVGRRRCLAHVTIVRGRTNLRIAP